MQSESVALTADPGQHLSFPVQKHLIMPCLCVACSRLGPETAIRVRIYGPPKETWKEVQVAHRSGGSTGRRWAGKYAAAFVGGLPGVMVYDAMSAAKGQRVETRREKQTEYDIVFETQVPICRYCSAELPRSERSLTHYAPGSGSSGRNRHFGVVVTRSDVQLSFINILFAHALEAANRSAVTQAGVVLDPALNRQYEHEFGFCLDQMEAAVVHSWKLLGAGRDRRVREFPRISPRKLVGARSSYFTVRGEPVIALCDRTFWGTGKKGFVVTTRGLYWQLDESKGKVKFAELGTGTGKEVSSFFKAGFSPLGGFLQEASTVYNPNAELPVKADGD